MATGRSLLKWLRVYCDGYDLSGMGRTIGPLACTFDSADLTAQMSDTVKGYLPNLCSISPGTYNGVLKSTTDSGVEVSRIQSAGTSRVLMIPWGIRGEPAAGDPVFACKSSHNGFQIAEDGGAVVINGVFGEWAASGAIGMQNPWGQLLIPNSSLATTTTSSSARDYTQASTLHGGFLVYQILTGSTGGWTIHVEDSTNDSVWADVEGATVTIADVSTPQAGIVAALAAWPAVHDGATDLRRRL